MAHRPIHWREGMFLRPQHFQAAERYWSEQIATSLKWENPYSYGVQSVRFSPEALSNFHIELSECRARMPDGTLIEFGVGSDPRVEIAPEAFDDQPTLRVFLGVRRLRLGHPNVNVDGRQGEFRYRDDTLEVPDESSGGQEQQISFRELAVEILLSTQDMSGYDTLPIGQIRRGSDEDGTPELDAGYFPPMLAVEAWAPLGRNVVRAIYDFLGKQQQLIGQAVVERGIDLAASDRFELDLISRLHVVNEAYATLRVLTFADGVHPFDAYLELCRIVAKLAIFRPERICPDPPPYDHDNLARIFQWVKTELYASFEEAPDKTYDQEYFTGLGKGMHVKIDAKWFEDWDWYVGVARGTLSEEECRQWLEPGFLNLKLGSASKVDEYFGQGMEGLRFQPEESPPSVFPSTGGWTYFLVNQEHPSFKFVQAEKSLAVRFSQKYIKNLGDLQGQRDLEVEVQGKQVTLRFALFALKRSRP